jgi:hypothetical protein
MIGACCHFPSPKGFENRLNTCGFDAKGHAMTFSASLQTKYQAWLLWGSPIDARPQTQRAVMAREFGRPLFNEVEFGLPNQ